MPNEFRPENVNNEQATKYKHEGMYKATPSFEEKQEERRNRYLSKLKLKRNNQVDEKRGIDEVLNDVEMPSETESDDSSGMKHPPRRKPRRKYYGHRIMLSEWLFSIPADLESSWYFKICPKGKRQLVVAHEGVTTAYNKRGEIQAQFESNLPGGCKRSCGGRFTILDCIYSYKAKKIFVLDLLAWNSYSYTEMNSDCRFFFLKSKLDELKDTGVKFLEVPAHRCEIPNLEYSLNLPFPEINDEEVTTDGVIFYHAEGLYRAGLTPLVLWLKPYMIPELFEVSIHEHHLRYRPQTYENFGKFIKDLQDKKNLQSRMEEEPLNESTEESLENIGQDDITDGKLEVTFFN